MLDFYFKAVDVLNSRSFLLAISKEQVEQDLPSIISSFAAHTDKLSLSLGVETAGKVIETNKHIQQVLKQQNVVYSMCRSEYAIPMTL